MDYGYPSHLTDREWALTVPFIPPAKSGGRRRTTDMREVVNAALYVVSSCAHGECCPNASHRSRWCADISTLGGTPDCSRRSIPCW